ncbi:MAG: hypothetical protein IJJ52_01650 [Lachnospiraceae bacterium]|nr:hypothetical protein [Lachnospiraceae bacterium]
MATTYMSTIGIAALIIILFAGLIISRNRAARLHFKKHIEDSWGQESPRLFLADDLAKIRRYSDSLAASEERWLIDDITANDVDLDLVFARIGRPGSVAGLEVLYAWLRHPLLKKEVLDARTHLINCAAEDAETRFEAQWILSENQEIKEEAASQRILSEKQEIKEETAAQRILSEKQTIKEETATPCRLKGDSVYGQIETLRETGPIGGNRFLLPGGLTLLGLLLLFVFPIAGIAVLIPSLFINFRIHLRMRDSSGPAVRAMQALLQLIRQAEALAGSRFAEKAGLKEELKKRVDAFSGFRRGAFLVTSGGTVGYGIADAVLEYLKMFFHIDLIRFDAMLEAYRGHEEDALKLLELVGAVDAAIAAADYREAHPEFAEPVLSEDRSAWIRAEEMVHPLLKNPTANSIEADGQVLLTGSNASGKSTFLKNVVLSAVMAQSLGIAPAKSYSAPFFRAATSMALSDNLMGGESYFIVEIRSLLRICKAAEEKDGAPLLAAIDEVLRGTNTVERVAAAAEILRSLDRENTLVFAATHDLELTYLLDGVYRNLHFRERVENGDVLFDYRLREGRAEGRNALKLLAAAGYDPEVVARAESLAARFLSDGKWEQSE